MFCSICGKELLDNALFCSNCGNRLSDELSKQDIAESIDQDGQQTNIKYTVNEYQSNLCDEDELYNSESIYQNKSNKDYRKSRDTAEWKNHHNIRQNVFNRKGSNSTLSLRKSYTRNVLFDPKIFFSIVAGLVIMIVGIGITIKISDGKEKADQIAATAPPEVETNASSNAKDVMTDLIDNSDTSDIGVSSTVTNSVQNPQSNIIENGVNVESKYITDNIGVGEYKEVDIDNVIIFGSYEQDGNINNGSEPIEWYVVRDYPDKTLLMSKYIVDGIAFNDDDTEVVWENCSLRTWLNDTFYNNAFTSEEQALILLTELENSDIEKLDGNEWVTVECGNNTKDYVFILSSQELELLDHSSNGFGKFYYSKATPFAKEKGIKEKEIDEEVYEEISSAYHIYDKDYVGLISGEWWFREPIGLDKCGKVFSSWGLSAPSGTSVSGIRPSICISK